MKNILLNINKTFDHRVRLGIMSVLTVNDFADFKRLKEILNVTDGNLASHLKTLEKVGYIQFEKKFINRKPNTTYSITNSGKIEFKKHIDALEKLIKNKKTDS